MPCLTPPLAARFKRRAVHALSVALLTAAAGAQATTYTLDVGTLTLGSSNNNFLFTYQAAPDGQARPFIYFLPQGGTMISSLGSAITLGELHSFDYRFSVAGAATLSQNPVYWTGFTDLPQSITLQQGSTVLATASLMSHDGFGYVFNVPSLALSAGTEYHLVVTTRGPTALVPDHFHGAQIALDVVAAPVPEPTSAVLMLAGLLGLPLLARRRRAP